MSSLTVSNRSQAPHLHDKILPPDPLPTTRHRRSSKSSQTIALPRPPNSRRPSTAPSDSTREANAFVASPHEPSAFLESSKLLSPPFKISRGNALNSQTELASSSPRSSQVTARTSSENTAVSIFSMYIDEAPIPEATDEGHADSLDAGEKMASGHRLSVTPHTVDDTRSASTVLPTALSPKSRATKVSTISSDSFPALSYLDGAIDDFPAPPNDHITLPPKPRPTSATSVDLYDAVVAAIVTDDLEVESPTDNRFSHVKDLQDSWLSPLSSKPPSQSVSLGADPSGSLDEPKHIRGTTNGAKSNVNNIHSTRWSPSVRSVPLNERRMSRSSVLEATTTSAAPPSSLQSPTPPLPISLSPTHPVRKGSSGPSASILSQPLSHRGADEDADAEHVRNTYARFEAIGGVPGDGFEEGIERTRARLPSIVGSNYSEERGPVKGGEMSSKENQVLRSLDRYGFFVTPATPRQESRLALLHAGPLARKVKRLIDSATPVPSSQVPSPPDFRSVPPSKPPTREALRIEKWNKMMRPRKLDSGGNVESWAADGRGTNPETFRGRVWKGIPDRWRPAAWQLLIDQTCESRRPSISHSELVKHFRENIDVPSNNDVQIDLDVPRTINNHVLFHTRYGQGQRSLFHILHCFSLHCSECEYCQGMGPIAATLQFYFDPERAYAGVVRLHDQYDMHSIFQPGFPGLLEAIYVQERLTEILMPNVYKSFKTHMISTTSYATKWYITLFANSVPFQTQLRIWDVFLLEGRDVIIIVAVAILWVLKDYLASPQASFETILSLLSSFFVPEDEDVLLQWVRTTLENKQIRGEMVKWRKGWKDLVASGQSHKALI